MQHVRLDNLRHIWEISPTERDGVFSDLLEHHPREVEFGKWIEFLPFADARVADTWILTDSRRRSRRILDDGETVRVVRRSRSWTEGWGPCQINTLPPVSPANTSRIHHSKIDNRLKLSTSGAAWQDAFAFERGGTVVNPNGILAAINVIVWRAPYPCTLLALRGYRVGGTGATVNARRNGSSNHLSSDLSLTSADTWMDGGAVQNTAYAVGDKLEIMVVSVTASPTQIGIQLEFVR